MLELSAADRIDAESGRSRAKTGEEMARDAEELQRQLMARIDGAASPPKALDASGLHRPQGRGPRRGGER